MNKKPSYEELEQKLEELSKINEEKLNQFLKNSFDIIVLIDENGIQHYVSESCERILGFKPEELTNIPVIEKMIHPDDQEATKLGLQNIIQRSDNGGTQYRHRHKNGGWVFLEAFGSNQIHNPFIKSVILNVRDITERKNAELILKENEVRLEELNATKDRFFSIIAHDLKSPFNSILGFSDLLVEQIRNEDFEGIEEYATIIQQSSHRVMNLLTNLLEWARSQTGRIEYNPEFIELVSIINEVVELLSDSADQKSLTISRKLPHNISVIADKAMINTILRNLISNGIKFTNRGGKIVISAEKKEREIVISVEDNGVGIKKEDIDKLFRIECIHTALGTDKETGTGLGLLLCKEFVEMHGGKIWVESNLQSGSKFSFSIPAY